MVSFFANSSTSLSIASACSGEKRCCLIAIGGVCSSIKHIRNYLVVHGVTRSGSSGNRSAKCFGPRVCNSCVVLPSLS